VILVWRGVDAASEIAFGEYQLGRIAARRGDAGEAMTLLESARTHFRAAGELNEVVVVDAAVAECLLLSGDHAAALAAAEKTLGRARALGGSSSATPLLHRVRGVALLALGRLPEAGRALRAALKAARERSALHEIAFTLKDLIDGEIAAGTAEQRSWQQELGSLSTELGIEPAAHPEQARRISARVDDPPAGVQTALA
jgi:tetratricopeptide (TPR) repeat protein